MESDKNEFPFIPQYQEAVIGHIFSDLPLFLYLYQKVEPSWFKNATVAKLYLHLNKFYSKVNRLPLSKEEMWSEFAVYGNVESNLYKATLDRCLMIKEKVGIDLIKKYLLAWRTAVGFREGWAKSKRLYDEGDANEAAQFLHNHLSEIMRDNFGSDGRVEFNDTEKWFEEDVERMKNACTTGMEKFDRLILPANNKNGCFLPGEATVFIAPTGTGKTTTLITIIKHNIFMKDKDVLWITHEDTPDNLKKKMFNCASQITDREIITAYKDPKIKGKILEVQDRLQKHLYYYPYNKADGMYVEDLMGVIKSLQATRKKTHGKGFDLIVDDYPARLTLKGSGRHDPLRMKIGKVYDHFIQLAIEEDLHCLLAMQTNRDASKANRKGSRLVTFEDASESFDVAMFAGTIITINRSETNRRENSTLYFVDKIRSGPGKASIVCNSRYDRFTAFSEELGGKITEAKDEPEAAPARTRDLMSSGQMGPSSFAQDVVDEGLKQMEPNANDGLKEILDKRNMQIAHEKTVKTQDKAEKVEDKA